MNSDFLIVLLIVLSFVLVAMVALLIRQFVHHQKLRDDHAATVRELRQRKSEDDLKIVQSQLNPHLFKNILNSIQSHAYQTYFALDKLATVLDYILYDSRQPFVTIQEETRFLQDLIEINKIKVSPLFELVVKIDIDEDDEYYTRRLMAPLLGVDLIENAFKHADIQSSNAFIKVVLSLHNGIFSLTVANKISGVPSMQKSKGGLGLQTLDQRLKVVYGTWYALTTQKENDEYIAGLKIDLRNYETEVRSVG